MHAKADRTPRHFLLLPAAGSGQRMAGDRPKQYLELLGKPVLQHTLERLGSLGCFERIVLVLAAGDPWWPAIREQLPAALQDSVLVADGGRERCHSVLSGLAALKGIAVNDDWVLVHDVVRPCVHADDVNKLLQTLEGDAVGGLLATPVRETLKRGDSGGLVAQTVDRAGLWYAATPQMFRYHLLQEALQSAVAADRVVTDEAEAVEAAGLAVRLVQGRPDNIKLTFPEDMKLAELILGALR